MRDNIEKVLRGVAILLVGVVIGAYGSKFGDFNSDIYNYKVNALIKEYYGDTKLNKEKLEHLYVEAVAKSVDDKYTFYEYGSDAKDLQESIDGSFCGIGITATLAYSGGLEVTEVFEDSPAYEEGMQVRDIIIGVDGEDVKEQSQEYIISKIKGPKGSYVRLSVLRDETILSLLVKRDNVVIPDVETSEYRDFAYVKIRSFSKNADEQFNKKVKELAKNKKYKGLILDLRDNTGGLLETVENIADDLMDESVLIKAKYKNKKDEFIKLSDGKIIDLPIVVLINEYTASASEILTGALRDNLGCELVGQKTYGKGIICSFIEYKDGSVMSISNGEYILPKGDKINNVGIYPTHSSVNFDATSVDEPLLKAIEVLENIVENK